MMALNVRQDQTGEITSTFNYKQKCQTLSDTVTPQTALPNLRAEKFLATTKNTYTHILQIIRACRTSHWRLVIVIAHFINDSAIQPLYTRSQSVTVPRFHIPAAFSLFKSSEADPITSLLSVIESSKAVAADDSTLENSEARPSWRWAIRILYSIRNHQNTAKQDVKLSMHTQATRFIYPCTYGDTVHKKHQITQQMTHSNMRSSTVKSVKQKRITYVKKLTIELPTQSVARKQSRLVRQYKLLYKPWALSMGEGDFRPPTAPRPLDRFS